MVKEIYTLSHSHAILVSYIYCHSHGLPWDSFMQQQKGYKIAKWQRYPCKHEYDKIKRRNYIKIRKTRKKQKNN